MQGDASHTFYISNEEATVISNFATGIAYYDFWSYNCTDLVIEILDLLGIEHPDFKTLGVSDPALLLAWLIQLNNEIPLPSGVDEIPTVMLVIIGIFFLILINKYSQWRFKIWLRRKYSLASY